MQTCSITLIPGDDIGRVGIDAARADTASGRNAGSPLILKALFFNTCKRSARCLQKHNLHNRGCGQIRIHNILGIFPC